MFVENGIALVDIRKDRHRMRRRYVRTRVPAAFGLRDMVILEQRLFRLCYDFSFELCLCSAGLDGNINLLARIYSIGYTHPQASMLAVYPRRTLTTSSAALPPL